MPPRPDLSAFMMSAGFMLTPTRFLDACHRRCGDYFTLRPAPDREIVFTVDPAAVESVMASVSAPRFEEAVNFMRRFLTCVRGACRAWPCWLPAAAVGVRGRK